MFAIFICSRIFSDVDKGKSLGLTNFWVLSSTDFPCFRYKLNGLIWYFVCFNNLYMDICRGSLIADGFSKSLKSFELVCRWTQECYTNNISLLLFCCWLNALVDCALKIMSFCFDLNLLINLANLPIWWEVRFCFSLRLFIKFELYKYLLGKNEVIIEYRYITEYFLQWQSSCCISSGPPYLFSGYFSPQN